MTDQEIQDFYRHTSNDWFPTSDVQVDDDWAYGWE
jgi:hypothetical protein